MRFVAWAGQSDHSVVTATMFLIREKEAHQTEQRAACCSRAAVGPPLIPLYYCIPRNLKSPENPSWNENPGITVRNFS